MDLMGWTPAAMFRYIIQFIHISIGLPWFWTIVASAAIGRLLVVPFAIGALQQSAIGKRHEDDFARQRAKISAASARHDVILRQKEAARFQEMTKEAGYSISKALISGVVPFVWSFGTFYGLARIIWNVPQVAAYSGFWLLPDMTAPTPPVLCAAFGALMFVSIRVSFTASC